jgi:predicted O-methyltransferase YrrM
MMKLPSPIILLKMKREIHKINNIYDAVDFAFSFQYLTFSIKPLQIKYEATKLLEIVKALEPKIILEIGTAVGGTLFLFSRIADPEATIISVDLPGGAFGGGYPEWKMPLFEGFAKNGQRIKFLRADSHSMETIDLVKTALGDRLIDFLFIDGDHTYESVKMDFEMYSPLVRKGGIIAFHDIVRGPPETVGGVPLFWNEVKQHFNYIELVENWKQGECGIGLIYL